jgi:diguanylate cyclase (GGDEF)-like protein
MIGEPLVNFMPERYRAAHPAHVSAFGTSGETQRAMGRLGVVCGLRSDGTEFPIEASISQVEFEGKKRFTAIFRDITQRLEHERRIARLTRIYAVLSGINSTIVRVRDRQKLFDEACRILTELGEFPTAWIGLLDPDTQDITPVAWRGPETDRDLVFGIAFSARMDTPEGATTIGRALRERRPVILNDLVADRDARAALVQMVERGYRSIVALPLVSGESCMGVLALHSMESGAFDSQEMNLLVELAGDIAFALEYLRREEEVDYLAFHDPVTGLANRSMLHQHLSRITGDADMKHSPFGVLLININNFRDINDTLGHKNGDILLRAIANRISSAVWESDVVACLGGDEFAVLLPHLASGGDIDLVVEKISDALQRPITVQGLPINLEASAGIALYPDHGTTADLLWQHADIALREAQATHSEYLLYVPDIDHYDPRKLALLGGIRDAIERNQFLLHFQPTIDLQTERTMGVEALLRWQHPERGLIFPDQFIPVVERTGLIQPLTTWVLANALQQGHVWYQSGLPLDVSVNLSARNLLNRNLAPEILDIVSRSSFPLGRLTLEVTESAIMIDPARAKSILSELNDAGIKISMDDFGIGQSSLSYLKDLPIRKLKIDKSFVMEYRKPRNAAIVRSAIELAHNLDITVTAEGVEDRATCQALQELGCEQAQGYYFSKPLPVDKVTDWLRTSHWKCTPS